MKLSCSITAEEAWAISNKAEAIRDENVEKAMSGIISSIRQAINSHRYRCEYWPCNRQMFGGPDVIPDLNRDEAKLIKDLLVKNGFDVQISYDGVDGGGAVHGIYLDWNKNKSKSKSKDKK